MTATPSAVPSACVGRVSFDELAARRRRQPTVISVFSGIGGAALGLRMAGFEIRVFVENNKDCCDTLRLNWHGGRGRKPIMECRQRRPPVILQADITNVEAYEILDAASLRVGEADCLEGGFPCQGFSTANSRRSVDDPRNQLYLECVRVIRGTLPRTFMLENVPGLVSMAGGRIVRMICEDLAASGYNIHWDILNAADYGVPQRRRRVFFIGERVDVATMTGGRMGLHMAAFTGQIHHPEWFLKKYPEKEAA